MATASVHVFFPIHSHRQLKHFAYKYEAVEKFTISLHRNIGEICIIAYFLFVFFLCFVSLSLLFTRCVFPIFSYKSICFDQISLAGRWLRLCYLLLIYRYMPDMFVMFVRTHFAFISEWLYRNRTEGKIKPGFSRESVATTAQCRRKTHTKWPFDSLAIS